MTQLRRASDIEIGKLIERVAQLEKIFEEFNKKLDQRQEHVDRVMEHSMGKVPIADCNERMEKTEEVVGRHTFYWKTVVFIVPFVLTALGWWFVEFIGHLKGK